LDLDKKEFHQGTYSGGCLCGNVRFEALGTPKYVFHCHCASCRRNMGAAIATFAGFGVPDSFRWTVGSPLPYESSLGVSRRFCARCGTPLSYESTRWPDEIHVSIGAFDEPGALTPQFHVHCSEQLPWLDTADGLPRFAHSSVGAEPQEVRTRGQPLTLISWDVCPYAQRTRMLLREKSIAFVHREVDLDQGKPEWFVKLSPLGQVPVLCIGEQVLWDSTAINGYLEEMHPDPPMLPSDAYGRAMARLWTDYCNQTWAPHMWDLLYSRDVGGRDQRVSACINDLLYIDQGMQHLSAGPYWFGDQVTLVDLAFYPLMERFQAITRLRSMEIPEGCTRYCAWYSAMRQRDSAVETGHSLDYYLNRYQPWI